MAARFGSWQLISPLFRHLRVQFAGDLRGPAATAILRRIERDVIERGRDIAGAKHQILATVLPMYEAFVRPTQRNAHFSINWEGEEIPEKATEGIVRMLRDHFR